MEYKIGQIFEGSISQEVHNWCAKTYETQQPCFPKEIEPSSNGTPRWRIEIDADVNQIQYKLFRLNKLQSYLSSTDWYAIRFADTGEPIPDEIKQKRQEAREEISTLREEIQ